MDVKEIEKSIIKKYRKDIWRPFTKAINEYELLKDGDKIAVCISGGKDSFLMAKCFQEIKRHFVFNIPVIERLNENWYQFTSEGRLQVGEYTSQSACEVFFSTYDENELYDALVKRLSDTYYNTEEEKHE